MRFLPAQGAAMHLSLEERRGRCRPASGRCFGLHLDLNFEIQGI